MLGAPLVYTLTGITSPSYILQDPPKHLDWFYDPQQKHGSWLQVDRSDSLNLTVTDSHHSAYSSQTDTTDQLDDRGLGHRQRHRQRRGRIGGRRRRRGRAQRQRLGRGPVRQEPRLVHREQLVRHAQHQRVHDRRRLHRRDDAHLAGLPLPHRRLRPHGHGREADPGAGREAPYGLYELTLPGPTVQFQRGGALLRLVPAGAPERQRPLLPRRLDSTTGLVALDPSTLGPPVTLQGSGETPVTLPQPLFNQAYLVDATGSSVELTIAQTTGSGNTTKTNGTLSESVDADAGACGKVNLGVGEADACADVDVKFDNSNSWGSLKTSSTSTTSTNTFTLQQDSAAQPSWAYGAATAYYTDPLGTYRVAHAVDLMASAVGIENWKHLLRREAGPGAQPPQPDAAGLQRQGQDHRHPAVGLPRTPGSRSGAPGPCARTPTTAARPGR